MFDQEINLMATLIPPKENRGGEPVVKAGLHHF
jgi:hypothetical protein